jgi:hypothetical protein
MRYCITLGSRPDGRITGWYDGSMKCWSTDRRRQKLFDEKRDAKPICREAERHADRINGDFNNRRIVLVPPISTIG